MRFFIKTFKPVAHTIRALAAMYLIATNAHSAIFLHTEAGTGMEVYSNLAPKAGALVITPAAASVLPTAASRPQKQLSQIARSDQSSQQSAREVDRRAILSSELQSEQLALKSATLQRAAVEVIVRHQSNVAALEREISRVR